MSSWCLPIASSRTMPRVVGALVLVASLAASPCAAIDSPVTVTLSDDSDLAAPRILLTVDKAYVQHSTNLRKLLSAAGDTHVVVYATYPDLLPIAVAEKQRGERADAWKDWRGRHVRIVLSVTRAKEPYGIRAAEHQRVPGARRIDLNVTEWKEFISSSGALSEALAYRQPTGDWVYLRPGPYIATVNRPGPVAGLDVLYTFSSTLVETAPLVDDAVVAFIRERLRPTVAPTRTNR